MIKVTRSFIAALTLLVAGGCATVPVQMGPSVMVWPTPGKPLDLFQAEDATCRGWAQRQIGMSPQEIANQNSAAGAAVGTAMGAVVGAAIGSASGNAGEGAIIGAGSGLLLGATSGAEAGAAYGWEAQRRYDIAYQQCMYANGNVVPGFVRRVWKAIPPPPSSGEGNYQPPATTQPYLMPPPPPSGHN